MTATSPLPYDDPRREAWRRYQKTSSGVNTLRWAAEGHEHAEGSLWSAFLAGYKAGQEAIREAGRERGR